MGEIARDLTTVLLAIVGVAVLAVLVSKNANTTGVLNSASSAFSTGLATAEGPVSGYSPGAPIYTGATPLSLSELGAGSNTAGAI